MTMSASTLLVQIACEQYRFGISDSGETYAVPRDGPRVVVMLRGGKTSLRSQLAREFFQRNGKTASAQALSDALLVIEGMAQDQKETRLYLRVARGEGAVWLDLGDDTGRAARVSPEGWAIEDSAPMLFKRTTLNSPLPEPVRGGSLAELWSWLNVTEHDRPLVAAWLISVLFCDIPHPVLGIFGEQGTGKTTAEKVLVQLLDPGPVPTRKPPRDLESWMTAAAASWVVGLDNLSDMPAWLSDSLCRAVTGDGDVRRKLYTDNELAVFSVRRCIVLNGIDLGALRGDLADRMLPIELHRIDEQHRREEEEYWPEWTKVHPRILGALLDLAAAVMGVLPAIRLTRKPRMADFARILAAVDQILGTRGMDRFTDKQKSMATDSLTGDPFITALRNAITDTFTGTASEILALLTPEEEKGRVPKGWPTTPRQVTQRLKRQAPPMRKAGWDISDDGGANRDKVVRWTITPPTEARESRNQPPQDPQPPQHGRDQHKRTREVRVNRGSGSGSPQELDHQPSHPNDSETAGHEAGAGRAGLTGHPSPPPLAQDESRCCNGGPTTLACQLCRRSPTYWQAAS
ncbi:ATP-binding protein [Longimycelium tulufanense]|uniref:ATP-binding protein n=1 Tax=Longimycelium tulufanense TaxID=907463 RepID=A0A8J3FT20_9PSEU|nr:ATP-binding protein [Longimycelium tulufanense]GGM34859.1 ATP-binding protein [Longimycelium tulufanense]